MLEECPVEVGQVVAGKYQVDSLIGQGGMGVVVSAHHIHLEQRVAIKFLLSDVAEHGEAAERFRREARAAAQIQSDHVARVLDVGALDGNVPYMVMEYLKGEDLREVLAEGRPLEIRAAVRYTLEACEAVSHAHAAGIIHRDLKPANLFLAERPDGSRRIKVLDFGISRSAADASGDDMRLTSTSTLIGSPLYMSPEQMRSPRDVDARTDIWSLGAILYEMLVARPPFEAETLPQLCELVLTEKPLPLSELRPEISLELETAVLRCLEREREDRWPSVASLAQALSPFQARTAGVVPAPDGNLQSTLTFGFPGEAARSDGWQSSEPERASRRKLALGVAALGLLALAGAFAVSSFGNTGTELDVPTTHRIESVTTEEAPDETEEAIGRNAPADAAAPEEPSQAVAERQTRPPRPTGLTRIEPVVDAAEPRVRQPRKQGAPRAAAEVEPPEAALSPSEAKKGLPDFGGRR